MTYRRGQDEATRIRSKEGDIPNRWRNSITDAHYETGDWLKLLMHPHQENKLEEILYRVEASSKSQSMSTGIVDSEQH